MEIKIKSDLNWLTVDNNMVVWMWEDKPFFEDGAWEFGTENSIGEEVESIELVDGDNIEHDKDKIWKRNGEDWEYAGGQVTKENARDGLVANLRVLLSHIGLDLASYKLNTEYTGYVNGLDISCSLAKSIALDVMCVELAQLCQLIKDAEGTGE